MKLAELISGLGARIIQGGTDVEITGVSHNSRETKPGHLFICVSGHRSDGHDFIYDAVNAGAAAVLIEKECVYPPGATIIMADSTPAAMAIVSDRFYGHPSGRLRLIGITGTKGKTTSTYLCKSVFEAAGFTGGLIGTIRNLVGDRALPTANTTPVSLDLQALLSEMVNAGVTHVAMEVSSHAIALGRINGCDFTGGIFTNISLDHLDFHGSFEEYLRAKVRFFELLDPSAYAVINRDDRNSAAFINACRCRVLTYSLMPGADCYPEQLNIRNDGTDFVAVTPAGRIPIALNLTGKFNVYNALGVITAMVAEGIALETIRDGLNNLVGVAGRFELVPNDQNRTVIVDYAHSPDSLENVLRTVKDFCKGRVIAVFGCGGDRDRTKRPIMGRIAAEIADYVVVTSDNPRTEDPRAILDEIVPGVIEGGKSEGSYSVIEDRREAIRHAIAEQKPDDVVLIAGKGHETYQILRDRTIHFDDREEARAALEALKP